MKNRINSFCPSLPFSSSFLTFLFPLFITILSLSIAQVATAQIPSNGLVGYWPFNGNANDVSGNGNNGTVNGATLTTDRFGNTNSSYSFDGNDKIEVLQWNDLIGNQSFSLSFWAKPSSAYDAWIVSFGNSENGQGFECGNRNWGGGSVFGAQIWIYDYAPAYFTTLTPNVWSNIVVSYDGINLKCYKDGIFIGQHTVNYVQTNLAPGVLSFGKQINFEEYFIGILDDISIYNRALTPSEITQLYTDQTSTVATPPCPTLANNLQTGLVGYWPFCGNANDESGNGNNGTVNGAVASLCPDRNGNINSAYNFQNALGGITVNSFDFPDENYTVSAWVNVTFDPTAISSKNIISHDWNNGGEMILFLNEPTSQSINFDCKPNTGNALPAPVNSNEWNHFVLQRQGLIFRLYLNGVLIQEGIKSSAPLIPNNNLFFGGDPVGTQFSLFNGKLDDICIWNRALTPAEITQLYTNPSVTPPVACTPFLGEDQTVCAGTSVTLSASGSSLACPTLPSNLQTGLVGYWPFCGNANDASGNGNNGTLTGGNLANDRFGNSNSALQFTSATQIMCTNNLATNPAEFSVFLWFNSANTQVTGLEGLGRIFGFDDGQCQHIFSQDRYLDMTATGQIRFHINHSSGNYYIVSSPGKNDGNWHSIACTFGSNGMKLYIDGVLESTNTNAQATSYSGYWRAGGLNDTYSPTLIGLVDDIALYNRILSISEIQQLDNLSFSAATYSWSTGATTASISVTPTQTTAYTCTITDANGNACTDSVTVFVPQIEATDLTICAGESTTLSVSGINSTATPTACPTLPSNLQTGLVGYWPFCGNANDASGNGNNGTVEGAALTTDRFGIGNSAYYFNGSSSSITINNNFYDNGWNENSIGIWFKPNSNNINGCLLNTIPHDGTAISFGNYGTNQKLYFGKNADPDQHLWNIIGGALGNNEFSYPVFNYNEWYFITVTKNGNTYDFYVNGAFDHSTVSTISPISYYCAIILGNLSPNQGYASEFYKGDLDDFSVWNRALSAAEILQLYNLEQTTYSWSNGATTPSIDVSPTSTTTYTCTTTINGVSCTDSITVVVNNPTIDLGNDITACGTSTTLTAPTAYDSYAWSNGGTSNTTIVTANGTYTCTVTQNGCSASDSLGVTLIDAIITVSDTLICSGESVVLEVPNVQPVQNLSYRIRQISTNTHAPRTSTIKLISNGVELPESSFTVTSNLNCVNCGAVSQSYPFGFSDNCSDQGWILLNEGIIQFDLLASVDLTSIKFYSVWPGCCRDAVWAWEYFDGSTWVTLNNISYNTSGCGAQTFNLNLPSEVWNNVLWSNGATTASINVSPTTTTTYTCTVTENGVSCTDSVTVVVNNPTLNLGSDVTACGTSTTLTAPTGYDSYTWSNGGTTNTTTVTSNGTYTCTVTQGGCSASDALDVTLIDATISATDSVICAGETVLLNVGNCPSISGVLSNGEVGFWPFCGNANDESGNGNNGTVNGAILTTDRFGALNSAYSFDGINDAITTPFIGVLGSQSRTVSFWADVNPFTSEITVVQYGSTSSANGPGDRFGCKFANNGIPSVGIDIDGSQITYAYPNLFDGWHLFSWTYSSADPNVIGNVKVYVDGNLLTTITQNYVPNSAAAVINTISDSPVVISANQYNNVFFGGKLDDLLIHNRALSASEIQQLYTIGQTTYLWSNGATTPTINVSPTSTTTYTCTVTTNGVSCTDAITVVVGNPIASITPNGIVEICQGQSISLTGNGGVSYLWNTGAPTQSITVNTEATYTVTVTDANGCTDTESQFVKVNQLPIIGVNNASICPGQSATLTATGGVSYVWSPATGLSATTDSTVTATPATSTLYTVTGTSANGCTNIVTAAVTVNSLPTATITAASATTFCQGGSVVLNANIGTGLSYQWYNNASAISGAISASYTANASGSYTVVVTNTSTCSSTSTAVVVTTIANVDYFADVDGDGFGDAATLVSTCVQPQGYVTDNTDCDDNDATVNTAATEVCNHIDDDCSGTIDDGLVFNTYYADNDGDTFGDANNSIDECSQPSGYVTNNTDCNDNNANQNSSSPEICNGEDDDCDGSIDNGLLFLPYFADSDGDGFGTGDAISSCTDLGAGYTDNNTDCDDTNEGIYPGAEELCNSIDDNCDGQTDDGTLTVFFIDNDGDTYGNPSVSILACTQPIGYTPNDNDCNDNDASINPDAEDIGGNGIDENCDGEIDNSIFELNATINLYPNPTRSELNIQISNALVGNDMYIFDAVGKLVYKQQLLSTQTTLSMSEYADGNYIFKVGEVVKRFEVMK